MKAWKSALGGGAKFSGSESSICEAAEYEDPVSMYKVSQCKRHKQNISQPSISKLSINNGEIIETRVRVNILLELYEKLSQSESSKKPTDKMATNGKKEESRDLLRSRHISGHLGTGVSGEVSRLRGDLSPHSAGKVSNF